MSFSRNGTPLSGPLGRLSAMAARALPSKVWTTAFKVGLTWAWCARAASSRSPGVTSRCATRSASATPSRPRYSETCMLLCLSKPLLRHLRGGLPPSAVLASRRDGSGDRDAVGRCGGAAAGVGIAGAGSAGGLFQGTDSGRAGEGNGERKGVRADRYPSDADQERLWPGRRAFRCLCAEHRCGKHLQRIRRHHADARGKADRRAELYRAAHRGDRGAADGGAGAARCAGLGHGVRAGRCEHQYRARYRDDAGRVGRAQRRPDRGETAFLLDRHRDRDRRVLHCHVALIDVSQRVAWKRVRGFHELLRLPPGAMLSRSKRTGWRFMAHWRKRHAVRLAAKDLRSDWRGWSRSERFTATLAGIGALYLALILIAPHAASLPW